MTNDQKEAARWIAVLPAAVVAGFILYVVLGSVMILLPTGVKAAVLMAELGKAIAFVIVGAAIAPRGRTVLAVALAIICVVLAVTTHLLLRQNWGLSNYLPVVGSVVGSLLALGFVRLRCSKTGLKS